MCVQQHQNPDQNAAKVPLNTSGFNLVAFLMVGNIVVAIIPGGKITCFNVERVGNDLCKKVENANWISVTFLTMKQR